jgi:hypothetical protein
LFAALSPGRHEIVTIVKYNWRVHSNIKPVPSPEVGAQRRQAGDLPLPIHLNFQF